MSTKPSNVDEYELSNPSYKTSWTAGELLATEFPDPKWAVPGIVPVGITFLAGRPKVGKSWLALQIAIAVATGGRALNEKIEPGRVLYLALEDSARRLKNRCEKMSMPATANIQFETTWKTLQDGGLVDLANQVTTQSYTFVIIDTFSRAIGRADQMDISEMTTLLSNLQEVTRKNDISILLNDHHRKSNGFESNPIDDILGSTAKAAVLDAALGLYREQGKKGAILKVTGRDLEEQELSLEWDVTTGCWQCLGNANDVREDTLKGEIIQAIRDLVEDGEIPTTRRIAKRLNKDDSNISHALADLQAVGRVKRGEKVGREMPYQVVAL
jgi:RecA-family ATPase